MVQVDTQLSQQDFLKFNFSHFFSKLFVKVFFAFSGFVALMSLLGFFLILLTDYEQSRPFEQLMPMFIMSALMGLVCWSVYAQSNRVYKTTNAVHEPIAYTFSDAGVHLKGKTFESELNWSGLYKIVETKAYFVFYQNNVAANLVPKKSFDSKEQVLAIRTLIASQPDLKHKLRKD
ncbi:YcxB family protein [Pontibacter sp. BT731]|uniref:YcxB family protein n=1 Tax=Pontibacter coccineus TaxID=3063328 RepID=UPI0026E132F7|nr:YcxB family protein [Pontibacter sp. BT731]MDO6391882.1 YcxB family protein [Pontibacter sp. BT731]